MRGYQLLQRGFLICLISFFFGGCASQMDDSDYAWSDDGSGLPSFHGEAPFSSSFNEDKYAESLPQNVDYGREKVILVDPNKFAWGAYDADGKLVRGGIASAGADYCQDEGHSCRTATGTFRIYSLGNADCVSHKFPLGEGGALMPYCMFFHGGQSLHGTPDQLFSDANISHGCVHMRIPDVEWLRYNFARVGTKVVVLPYE